MHRQLLRSRAADVGIILISYFFALSAGLSTWREHPMAFTNVLQPFFFGQRGLRFSFLASRNPKREAREQVVVTLDHEEAPVDAEAPPVITVDEHDEASNTRSASPTVTRCVASGSTRTSGEAKERVSNCQQ